MNLQDNLFYLSLSLKFISFFFTKKSTTLNPKDQYSENSYPKKREITLSTLLDQKELEPIFYQILKVLN